MQLSESWQLSDRLCLIFAPGPGRASERLTQEEGRGGKRERASELWRRHIPSGRTEATFADFGAGILRQTASDTRGPLQKVSRPRPDREDSGPHGRPEAGFYEDWASEGTEVHFSSVRGAGRPADLWLSGNWGGRWQPRSVRLTKCKRRKKRRTPLAATIPNPVCRDFETPNRP